MTLDQEDIKAIADEVVKRLLPYLAGRTTYAPTDGDIRYVSPGNSPPGVRETSRQWADRVLRELEAKREEQERLDSEIRAASAKMPPDLRPHPDQYKSASRKKQVLKMVQDPTRWADIPGLSRQWVKGKGRKR